MSHKNTETYREFTYFAIITLILMIIPKTLQENDTIGVVSTARKISLDEIKPAIKLLESWNLKVKIGKTIGLENYQFAGTDEQRTNDFQTMLDDDEVKAIWCARGGYGTVKIIDALDFSKFKTQPKWIIGYSDVTVLHNHINNLGFESLHATMPINVDKNSVEALQSLKDALFGKPLSYEVSNHKLNILGEAESELIGGNLSMLYSQLGSKSALKTDGKILFLEDLDEYLYHIDRMMQNLKRNDYFNGLKGLIVGGMSDMNDNTISFGKTAEKIIFDVCKDFGFPICFGFPAGHLDDNRTLIFGRTIQLVVSSGQSTVKFL